MAGNNCPRGTLKSNMESKNDVDSKCDSLTFPE